MDGISKDSLGNAPAAGGEKLTSIVQLDEGARVALEQVSLAKPKGAASGFVAPIAPIMRGARP